MAVGIHYSHWNKKRQKLVSGFHVTWQVFKGTVVEIAVQTGWPRAAEEALSPAEPADLTSVHEHVVRHAEGAVQGVSEHVVIEADRGKAAVGRAHQRVEKPDEAFHFSSINWGAETQANLITEIAERRRKEESRGTQRPCALSWLRGREKPTPPAPPPGPTRLS